MTDKILKRELVSEIVARTKVHSGTATAVMETVFDVIGDALCDGTAVQILNFGVFEAIAKPACMSRNPKTGETQEKEATLVVKFRPSASLKKDMHDCFTDPEGE